MYLLTSFAHAAAHGKSTRFARAGWAGAKAAFLNILHGIPSFDLNCSSFPD
jgi:hypothetical protein